MARESVKERPFPPILPHTDTHTHTHTEWAWYAPGSMLYC